MLTPAYNYNLKQSIKENLVTIAKFDGDKPCMVCATVGGKVFIHSPHNKRDGFESELVFLNLNKNVVAISAGPLDPGSSSDTVFFGSQNTLIAHDVQKNSDLFYKEVPDGINSLIFGNIAPNVKPLVIVGGNCSIQGFDKQGDEVYWNVSGDNVSALGFADIDEDGVKELIVGSEDNMIRVLKNEDIMLEINEIGKPITLCSLSGGRFGYGLNNGNVGVYKGKQRQWRVKSKFKPISVVGLDPEEDNVNGLVIGWENGKIEIRSDISGETIYKMQLNSNLAKVLKYDYRMDRTNQIICVSIDGSVKGFTITGREQPKNEMLGVQNTAKLLETMNDLVKRKNELLMEITLITESHKGNKKSTGTESTLVPPNTKLAGEFRHNQKQRCPELFLYTNTTAIIRSVIIFAEQIFSGESFVYCPQNPTSNIAVPIRVRKNKATDLNLKILVGNTGNSTHYQVFEMTVKLPRFSSFMCVTSLGSQGISPSSSSVTFTLKERIPRFTKWIEQCFIVEDKFLQNLEKQDQLEISFLELNSMKPLQLYVYATQNGKCVIKTDSIELAGDVIQDLASFMNVSDLESNADFHSELEHFKAVLKQVNDFNQARMHITADIAESVNNVKSFIVRAEDSRILSDMKNMKKMYTNIMIENRNLVSELIKRSNNHEGLLAALKEVNQMINKAVNLRYGNPKNKVISLCRNAIKSNNIFSLIQIIQTGKEI